MPDFVSQDEMDDFYLRQSERMEDDPAWLADQPRAIVHYLGDLERTLEVYETIGKNMHGGDVVIAIAPHEDGWFVGETMSYQRMNCIAAVDLLPQYTDALRNALERVVGGSR